MGCDNGDDIVLSLQKNIGYTFRNRELAREALTHASRSSDKAELPCNERLEFLGDAVLQIIISSHLFNTYSDMAEGQLSRVRAAVVSAPSLKKVADTINLSRCIALGNGMEQSGGRGNANILADAVEAVLAAIYLDSGLDRAREFILPLLQPAIEAAAVMGIQWDSKTRLQEMLQKNGDIRIEYMLDEMSGPAHDRQFTVSVLVEGQKLAQGQGKKKKDAQQDAARRAVELLESSNDESGLKLAPQKT